jgi:hypothetical protein
MSAIIVTSTYQFGLNWDGVKIMKDIAKFEQILNMKQKDPSASIRDLCKQANVKYANFYNWRRRHKLMGVTSARHSNSEKFEKIWQAKQKNPALSILDLCQQAGVKYTTFYHWRKRTNKNATPQHQPQQATSVDKVLIEVPLADLIEAIMKERQTLEVPLSVTLLTSLTKEQQAIVGQKVIEREFSKPKAKLPSLGRTKEDRYSS